MGTADQLRPHLAVAAAHRAEPRPRPHGRSFVEATGAVVESGEQGGDKRAGKWVVLSIVAAGMFTATLSGPVVAVILPSIADYFNAPLSGTVEWIVIGYLVILAALQLTGGRLADMFGRKPVWTVGLAIFTVGSAVCAISPSLEILVAARVLQAIGGALAMAVSPAMLAGAFPKRELGRAMGWNALVIGAGNAVGPTAGGLIASFLTWRGIFFLNVPIGIIAIVATLYFLHGETRRKQDHLDIAGTFLLVVGLGSFALGMSFGHEWGWTSPAILGIFGIAVLALGMVIPVERRVESPAIDFSIFDNRIFARANLNYMLSFLALFAIVFLMPFYLVQLRGFSIAQAGLIVTPYALMLAVIGPFSGFLCDRIGARYLSAGGLVLCCLALILIAFFDQNTPVWSLIATLSLAGIGQGLFYPPNNSVLMGSAPRHQRGAASGIMGTSRAIGQSICVAVTGAIFAILGGSEAGNLLAGGARGLSAVQVQELQLTFVNAFRVTFLACCVVAAIAIFTCLTQDDLT